MDAPETDSDKEQTNWQRTEGRTCYILKDKHCPECGGDMATDGSQVWCMDCN
jgi:DNA polymerase III alpha subunit (gram-positive type)